MPYTSGTWIVKPGMEDAFIEAWGDFATWTTESVDGALWAVLSRDDQDPQKFISMGPWESREAIDAWRALPEFKEAFGAMRDMIESVDVHVLEPVFEAGPA